MKKYPLITGALVLALGSTLAGCHKKAQKKAGKKGAIVAAQGTKVGLLLANSGSAFDKGIEAAAKKQAKTANVELVVADSGGTAAGEKKAIEELAGKGLRVLAIHPVDAAQLTEVVQRVHDQGVSVVSLMQAIPNNAPVLSVIEYNRELAGELSADYLRDQIKGGGKVALLKGPGAAGEGDEEKAFLAYLKKYAPSLELLPTESGQDAESLRATADRLVSAHSDLKAVVTLSDLGALAATAAVRARGAKSPFVVGTGGSPEAIKELVKGDSPLALVLAALPQRIGNNVIRMSVRASTRQKVSPHRQFFYLPITRKNSGTYPGYDGAIPRVAPTIPWTSNLELQVKATK